MKDIVVFIGTRPDTLKLIPIISILKKNNVSFDIIATGQHISLLKKVLNEFEIFPDDYFMIKRENLLDFSGKLFIRLKNHFSENSYKLAIVQGDTTTSAICGLASFYSGIKVIHIEAGLRSGDIHNPFPEEVNRKIIAQIADIHFAPTQKNRRNLIKEGVSTENIMVVGNTIIDLASDISKDFEEKEKYIFITLHRSESWGKKIEQMCYAIKELSNIYCNYNFIFPIHPNPIVKNGIKGILGKSKVKLFGPFSYKKTIKYLKESKLILTDSGGIQEEASFFGKPIVVLREKTERQELVEKGIAVLAGSKKTEIIRITRNILDNPSVYSNMSKKITIYGNGNSAKKIFEVLKRQLCVK